MESIHQEDILKVLEGSNLNLNSTHSKLCLPIINRIYKKMKIGLKFDAIKTCEKIIIDGHHRYISSLLANIELDQVQFNKTKATMVYDWKDVEFVDEAWDTNEKIKRLNELDADFNNISIQKIIDMTN
jgi:hypothetical protein